MLAGLERTGEIARIKGNRYIHPRDADLVPGRIRMNRQGKGFLQPDDPKLPEIIIPEHATSTAFNGDRVLVRRDVRPQAGGAADRESRPVRSSAFWSASARNSSARCSGADNFFMSFPMIRASRMIFMCRRARDVGRPPHVGDKVVVELQEWESRNTNPEGEIIEVLGAPDEEGVDMLSVLRQYNLPLHFPKKALHEARAIGTEVRAAGFGRARRIAGSTRSSPLIRMTPRISTMPSACSRVRMSNGSFGCTSRMFRIT